MGERQPKIVLFGQRRSGTTAAFQAFRACPELTCYYEPFHPKLVRSEAWDGVTEIERDEKGVFGEYRQIEGQLGAHFAPLGAPLFPVEQEIDPRFWTPAHDEYLTWLLEQGPATLVQPVRANHHLEAMVRACPEAHFVWIAREGAAVVSSQLRRYPAMFDQPLRPSSIGPSSALRRRLALTLGRRRSPQHGDGPVDHWSQGATARVVLRARPYLNRFLDAPAHVQLLALWYDHLDVVSAHARLIPPGQFSILRYEDLCRDPDRVVAAICLRVGIEPPTTSLRSVIDEQPPAAFRPDDPRWEQAHASIRAARAEAGLTAEPPRGSS